MTPSESVTFHVLFIPGTVRYLRIFMPSLAAWGGGSRIRFVSNGCSPDEVELLLRLVKLSPRFDFYRLPGRDLWEHGAALSHLQQRETGTYFAIMDSDIFATGDYLGDLFARAGRVDALFSGSPLWSDGQSIRIPHGFKIANCPFVEMEDGFCIGGTYFAIYDNRVLSECLATNGVHMGRYLWTEIPMAVRDRLRAQGREKIWYDPLKLVNILMNLDGHDCRFLDTRFLHHVGGVSNAALSRSKEWSNLFQRCCSALIPDLFRQVGVWTGFSNPWHGRLSWDEIRHIFAKCHRRNAVSTFFYQLLQSLDVGETLSPFTSGDADFDARIRQFEMLVRQSYPTWSTWMNGCEPIVGPGADIVAVAA